MKINVLVRLPTPSMLESAKLYLLDELHVRNTLMASASVGLAYVFEGHRCYHQSNDAGRF